MTNIEEGTETAAAHADAAGEINYQEVTNVVQNYIPVEWLASTLPKASSYALIVKQVFIMQAGATVKMRRCMDAAQRNYDSLLQYNAWVENLHQCYPRAAILKYMQYTTKTMRKKFNGRDVYRKFTDGLEKFQNVFTPTWNAVLADGISGKTWPEIWMKFVGKLVNSEDVNRETLSSIEFKQN